MCGKKRVSGRPGIGCHMHQRTWWAVGVKEGREGVRGGVDFRNQRRWQMQMQPVSRAGGEASDYSFGAALRCKVTHNGLPRARRRERAHINVAAAGQSMHAWCVALEPVLRRRWLCFFPPKGHKSKPEGPPVINTW